MALFKSKKKQAAELFESGAKGAGTVMSVQDTGMTVNDNPRVKMIFRVEPLDGSAPFEAEKKTVVSRVQIPRAGERYPVWYDAADPTTWAYATVDNDEGREQLRMLFGSAADTFAGVGGAPTAAAPAAAAPANDPIEQIKKLDELRTAGLLTDSEFEEKKAQLLAAL